MFPNQPPQTPNPFQPQEPTPAPSAAPVPSTAPADYLSQIAPQTQTKAPFTFGIKQILIISAILIVLVIILVQVVGAVANSSKRPLQQLSARLTTTEKIATESQANLKSSTLRSLNSNLKLYLANTNRDIGAPLLAAGVDSTKLSAAIVAAESATDLQGRLVDARLNAVFDRTYAREMTYQLGTIMTLLSETYNASSSASVREFLKSAYDNLKPTQESFANFSTTE